jgi:hypothetical protein
MFNTEDNIPEESSMQVDNESRGVDVDVRRRKETQQLTQAPIT